MAQWSTTAADNSNSDAGLPVMSDTMDPIGLDNVPRGMMAALAKWRKDVGGAIEAGGTANALTATSSSGYEAAHLVDGFMVVVRAASDNTNATVTLNVDSTGAKGIKRADGSALAVGSIKADHVLLLFYNADNSEWWAANIAPASSALSDIVSSITPTDGVILVGDGTTFVGESGATARTSLGVAIGSDVQAYSAKLAAIAALAVTDGNFVVGNGTTFVAESGSTARTSLGLGSLATLSSINNGNWSGTDLAVANGGTGASDASGARSNLGLGTSDSPQFTGVNIGHASDTTLSRYNSGNVAVEGGAGGVVAGAYFLGASADTVLSRYAAEQVAVNGEALVRNTAGDAAGLLFTLPNV